MVAQVNSVEEKHRLLLELSRDIDRNLSDHEFERNGGRINYVFDENIFEYFVGAIDYADLRYGGVTTSHEDKRRLSATFHREAWRPADFNKQVEHLWVGINRAASVIASEYLFSGTLPGQMRPARCYVSQWHWNETLRRLRILARHFTFLSRNFSSSDAEETRFFVEEIKRLDTTSSHFSDVMNLAHRLGVNTDYISRDVESLRSAGVGDGAVSAYAFNMVVVSFLSSGRIDVNASLIADLFGHGEIGSRIKPLYLLGVHPTSAQIRKKADVFISAIREEERIQKRKTPRRNGSVLSDAYTLAYVELVNENLTDEEIVVFVTGDELIFDAYRRVWLEDSSREFILRRPIQYVPLLNTLDMDVGISSEQIFEKVRVAIEPALMFFNLARQLSSDGGESSPISNVRMNVGREFLALYLKSNEEVRESPVGRFFRGGGMFGDGTVDSSDVHEEIGRQLRQFERLTIGGASRFVLSRFERAYDEDMMNALVDSTTFAEYIERGLGAVFEINAEFHVPIAFRAVSRWLRSTPESRYDVRVPIACLLAVPEKADQLDAQGSRASSTPQTITSFVDEFFGSYASGSGTTNNLERFSFDNRWLSGNPVSLFAAGSVIALRISMWEEASEYAEIALRSASRRFDEDPGIGRRDYVETLYLYCLARRFDVLASGFVLDQISEVYEDLAIKTSLAINLIEIEFPQNGSTANLVGKLVKLRARSEAIAMSAFYVAALATEMSDGTTEEQFAQAMSIIVTATNSIKKAVSLLRDIEEDLAVFNLGEVGALNTIRRQIIANSCAIFCLEELINLFGKTREADSDLRSGLYEEIDHRLENLSLHTDETILPGIVKLEMEIFRFLRSCDEKHRTKAREIADNLVTSDLIYIDKTLANIYRKIIE